jgi:energy-coupling factor transporter ATP-binding protein EcfA2
MSGASANVPGSMITELHYHAFLSHNGADKPAVRDLAAKLEERGLACWLDEWNLIPGNPWQPAIEEALGQCDTCLVFFGPHGLGPWHNEEMRLAIQRRVNSSERRLRVLPVILPGGQRAKESDVPGFLQGTTWVEFRQSLDDGDALHRLVCGIKGIPPGRRLGATVLEGECPYPGLKTFQPEDAPLFFGRTAKIQELVERLRNNSGALKEERFLALIGASGSGKSSLALAGLIPAVRRGDLSESEKWPLIRCRPGARPWENVQIALSNNQKIAPYVPALPALITRPEDEQRRLHLTAQLALHDQPGTHRLFVLIDQFEEIFTLCNDEAARRQLIENVLYATSVVEGRTIVVLTMRADFYGQCASYPGLRAAIADHQSLIGPLSEEELRDAVESPAQLAGSELEPGLMELLLADMRSQAGALPFLEHALFKLWEKRDGRRLTAKAYLDMGRLQGALDAHAEDFFAKTLTTEEEQSLCRQVLLDLIHPGEGTADTKKRVSLDDVAPTDATRAVLKKLADARLVTTDRDDRPESAQAELAHEALIRGWRRLSEWVNENREKSRLKERLLDSGREWQRSSKKEDFLYRGAQLATAQEIFGSSAELPKIGREFLEASIAARKRAQEEKQSEQRRRQRLLAAASGVFALLAVVASAAAIFGFWQKSEAKKKAKLAIQAEQSAKAQATLARAAEKRTSEVASQASVSLARYSKEAGKDADALAYLAQALRLNQKNNEATAFVCTMLTQSSWPRRVVGPMRHKDWIQSVEFSPDGQRVLTASEDRTAQLWEAATGKPLGERMKHEGGVWSAQFSPDGLRVVTASWDKTARLWEAATGKAIGEPMQHGGPVYSAQFSPDGQRLVSASEDKTARLWDAATGKAIGAPMRHYDVVVSAQFSSDGQRVVTASSDGTARLWDAVSGQPLGEPMKHDKKISAAHFSPDGQRVVTAAPDGTARLWDAVSGKAIGEPMKHGNTVQFSSDGQRVVTASPDGTVLLWDAASGRPLGEPMTHESTVHSVQFSPDGQRVVTASWMGRYGCGRCPRAKPSASRCSMEARFIQRSSARMANG